MGCQGDNSKMGKRCACLNCGKLWQAQATQELEWIKRLNQKQSPDLPSHVPVTEHGELLLDGKMPSLLPIHYHSQNYLKEANRVFSEVGLSKWNWLRALCSNCLWESLDKRRFQSIRTIASALQLRECVLQSFNKQLPAWQEFQVIYIISPLPSPTLSKDPVK